jgi:type VI protein secretion system component Hcp
MKSSDKSSPVLFQKCCDGSVIATADVTLQRQVQGVATPYLVYHFDNVFVTGVQWSGSGGAGDTPMESITFCFEVGQIDYTPQNDDGSPAEAVHGGWDIGQNIKA